MPDFIGDAEANQSREKVADDLAFPLGFSTMQDVLDGKSPSGSFVSVVGLIRDLQAPMKSGGSDWKTTFGMMDKSLEETGNLLKVHIFADERQMPEASLGDVVLIRSAKVQYFRNIFTLVRNLRTVFFIFPSATIPRPPLQRPPPLRPCRLNSQVEVPKAAEYEYAAWLYHAMDKSSFPDIVQFNDDVERSRNVVSKDKALCDLIPSDSTSSRFNNLLVHVILVKIVRASGAALLWVSDYTEHPLLEEHPYPIALANCRNSEAGQGQVGDAMGYLSRYNGGSKKKKGKNDKEPAAADWSGPYGRRTMLISCFHPHSQYIEEYVRRGHWVELKNVHIKMGSNNRYMEGFLRMDEKYGNPIRVERIIPEAMEREEMSPQLVAALKSKRKYEKDLKLRKQKNKKRKAELAAFGDGGDSRERPVKNKKRRQEKRSGENALLNQDIVCSHGNQPVTPLATVLEPVCQRIRDDSDSGDGGGGDGNALTNPVREVVLPFVNLCSRAKVRVVDFWPPDLRDFAAVHKISEYDVLSDANSNADGDSDGDMSLSESDSESDSDADDDTMNGTKVKGKHGRKSTLDAHLEHLDSKDVWEWRFALLLEDATNRTATTTATTATTAIPVTPTRVWAVVDDMDAQELLRLDADNLRTNKDLLRQLTSTLFLMWGNLAELKRAAARQKQNDKAKSEKAKREEATRQEAAAAAAAKVAAEATKQRAKEGQALQKMSAQQLQLSLAEPEDSDEEMAEDRGQGKAMGETKGKVNSLQQEKASKDVVTEPQPLPLPPQLPPQPPGLGPLQNRPFICCLRQYGVRTRRRVAVPAKPKRDEDSNGNHSDDNDEGRVKKYWERMFGLFGTTIQSA